MRDLGHGANVNNMSKLYNKSSDEIIDFSSNVNPKVIDNLEEYILEGIKESRSYPDIDYTNLRSNISKYINVNSDYIIPGNGATEVIYLLMKCIGKRLAILNPTFSEYERSASLNNLEIINFELDKENDFELDLENIKENIHKFDSLFICNPNNPNGRVQDLIDLLDIMIENNKFLIIDETFMEFVEEEDDYSLIKYIEKYENIFILKAVTKFFGMPGLRLGYGVTSNKSIIEKLYEYKEPWTINSFADTLSRYIFKDEKYIQDSKKYYINERKYMIEQLNNIGNITVYSTDTNFILLKLQNISSEKLKEDLFKNSNILIRDASNFIGLDSSFVRVAIKSHEENEILLKEMRRLVGN